MVGMCLLYKALESKDIEIISSIQKKWLVEEEYEVLKKIKAFIKKYESVPPVEEIFPQKPETYNKGYPITYWMDKVRDRYASHLIKQIKLWDADKQPVNQLHKLYKTLADFYSNYDPVAVLTSQKFQTFTKDMIKKLRRNRINGYMGYETGYPSLDDVTGGYIPSEIFVFVARLKMGKTMYLLNSLSYLLKQKKCMFVSMEMSLESIIRRLLAIRLHTPQFLDQRRIVPSFLDEEIKKLRPNLILVNGASLSHIYDISALITLHQPEIVFIDGAYLLDDYISYKSEWERAKRIIEKIKKVAMGKKVPIVCSYQLNRMAVKSKEGPEVHHVALSDAIAQTAGVMVAVYEHTDETKRNFRVLVNREGPSKIEIEVNFDFINMNFNETGAIRTFQEVDDEVGW